MLSKGLPVFKEEALKSAPKKFIKGKGKRGNLFHLDKTTTTMQTL